MSVNVDKSLSVYMLLVLNLRFVGLCGEVPVKKVKVLQKISVWLLFR